MSEEKKTVFAICANREITEKNVNALRIGDFQTSKISVLLPSTTKAHDFFNHKNISEGEDSAVEIGAGMIVGGALGLLIGSGSAIISGLGSVIAAGPIMTSIVSMGLGETTGAFQTALISYGALQSDADKYENLVKAGNILVFVSVDEKKSAEKAKQIFKRNGATNISAS